MEREGGVALLEELINRNEGVDGGADDEVEVDVAEHDRVRELASVVREHVRKWREERERRRAQQQLEGGGQSDGEDALAYDG